MDLDIGKNGTSESSPAGAPVGGSAPNSSWNNYPRFRMAIIRQR
jgi:hypothetical protein